MLPVLMDDTFMRHDFVHACICFVTLLPFLLHARYCYCMHGVVLCIELLCCMHGIVLLHACCFADAYMLLLFYVLHAWACFVACMRNVFWRLQVVMLHARAWSGFGTFMMFLFASMVLVCFMIFAKDKGSS